MMKKSLLVDVQKWTEEPNWGIPVFTYNLIKNFIALNEENKKTGAEYLDLYFLQDTVREQPEYDKGKKTINKYKELSKYYIEKIGILRSGADYIYNKLKELKLNKIYRMYNRQTKKGQGKEKFDAIYLPNAGYYFPPFKADMIIATIHDIAGIDRSQNKSLNFRNYLRLSERKRVESNSLAIIKRSDIITTVSNYTKSRLIDLLNIDGGKIKIIPNGVDMNIFKPVEDGGKGKNKVKEYLKNMHNIERPFILYVGAIQPRKNIKGLLDAYIYSEPLKKIFDMVIVAGQIWQSGEELKLISKYSDNIHLIRNVRVEELPLFYNAAEVFIYPSFYEGFGTPLLEAFACGTPVAVSDRTSLPEVGGEAAVYFNPYEIDDIRQSLESLIFDDELKYELVKKGFARVKDFTWEKAAKKLLEIVELN